MTPVFVDTSAFVALVDRKDENHGRARRALRALCRKRRSLVTSTYVFDETLTLLRLHVSHRAAVRFGEELTRSGWCRTVDITEELRQAAWHCFVRYDDQRFSFTDCTSFAVMGAMEIRDAFTFDSDFRAAGFQTLPTS